MPEGLTLAQALDRVTGFERVSQLESLLRARPPGLGRGVIHVEPPEAQDQ